MQCYCLLLLLLLYYITTSNKFESIKHNNYLSKKLNKSALSTNLVTNSAVSHNVFGALTTTNAADADQMSSAGTVHSSFQVAGRLTRPSHTVSGDDACTCAAWSRLAAPTCVPVHLTSNRMCVRQNRGAVDVFVHPTYDTAVYRKTWLSDAFTCSITRSALFYCKVTAVHEVKSTKIHEKYRC